MEAKEIKLVSEILVDSVKNMKESTNGLQQMFLEPYVKIVQEINNYALPKTYVDSRMHTISFAILDKIAQDIDRPIEDEIDARGRLNKIYDLVGTCVNTFKEVVSSNLDTPDDPEYKEIIENLNSQMVREDIKTMGETMSSIVKDMKKIVAVNVTEDMLREMERAKEGSDEDKREFLEKVFTKGI